MISLSLWIFLSILLLIIWVFLKYKYLFLSYRQSFPEKCLNEKKKQNCDFIVRNIGLLKKREINQIQDPNQMENQFLEKQTIKNPPNKILNNNSKINIYNFQWKNNDEYFDKKEEIENENKEEILHENIYFQKKEECNQLFQEKNPFRKIKPTILEARPSSEHKKNSLIMSPIENQKPIQINREESSILKKENENIIYETPKKFFEKTTQNFFEKNQENFGQKSAENTFQKPLQILKPNSNEKINEKSIEKGPKIQENILNPTSINEEKKNIPMQLEIENPLPQSAEPKLDNQNQEQIHPKVEVNSFFSQNKKKIENINKFFQENESKIFPEAKEEIEGTIRKAIGQLYGTSFIRLYETSEELILLNERFKKKEYVIFFAHQLVKITLKNQISNFFSQNEDKSTMRDRVARIAILLHLVNLHCPCLIDFCMLIINEEIPLLGNMVDQPVKKDKSPKYFYNKIEAYSYLYFCILALDLDNFYSEENVNEMKKRLSTQEQPAFYYSVQKLKKFLESKKNIKNYHEFYWEFVKTFFKLPICEVKVVIAISFCYASYLIWKNEGVNIIKIIQKINDKYLPLLKDFQAKIKDKNEQNIFRLNYGRLEEIVEIICNKNEIPSFEEQKDDD